MQFTILKEEDLEEVVALCNEVFEENTQCHQFKELYNKLCSFYYGKMR